MPPFTANAVDRGCHVLARGDQVVSNYQGTIGAAKRSWAVNNGDVSVGYIRAYAEATQRCFEAKIVLRVWSFSANTMGFKRKPRNRHWIAC